MLSGSASLLVQYTESEQDYGTPFYVEDYGAVGDGSTDDGPAIQRTYNAAWNFNKVGAASAGAPTCVVFGEKTYYVSSGWNLNPIRTNDWYGASSPTIANNGVIAFYGPGATIKYAPTGRFTWLQGPNPTALYSTYGNLIIDGLTIDPNDRLPGGECGDTIWIQGDGNVDNITVRNITTLDNKPHRGTLATPPPTSGGVMLLCAHESRSQAHYGYTTDITIEDSNFYGGKGIAVYAANRGTDTTYGTSKYVIDNVNIARCTCDSCDYYTSTIHLGSYAAGYRCSVIDCHNANCSDDGIEIDAFNEVLVQGCSFTDIRQPICFTWFSYPYLATTPTYTVRDCTYSGNCHSYWENGVTPEPADRAPMMPEFLDGGRGMNDRDHGHLVVSGTRAEIGVTNDYGVNRAIVTSNSRLASVTISDIDVTDARNHLSTFLSISQQSSGATLPVSINDVRQRRSTSGSYSLLTASQVYLSRCSVTSTDITGLT